MRVLSLSLPLSLFLSSVLFTFRLFFSSVVGARRSQKATDSIREKYHETSKMKLQSRKHARTMCIGAYLSETQTENERAKNHRNEKQWKIIIISRSHNSNRGTRESEGEM